MIACYCCESYTGNLHAYLPAYYVMIKSFCKVRYNNDDLNKGLNEFKV